MTRKTRRRLTMLLLGCAFALGLTYLTRPQPKWFRIEGISEGHSLQVENLGPQNGQSRTIIYSHQLLHGEYVPPQMYHDYWILDGDRLTAKWRRKAFSSLNILGFRTNGELIHYEHTVGPDGISQIQIRARDFRTDTENILLEFPGEGCQGCVVSQDMSTLAVGKSDFEHLPLRDEGEFQYPPPRLETYSLNTGLKLAEWPLVGRSGKSSFGYLPWSAIAAPVVLSTDGQRVFVVESPDSDKEECPSNGIEEYDARSGELQRVWDYPKHDLHRSLEYDDPDYEANFQDEPLQLRSYYFLRFHDGQIRVHLRAGRFTSEDDSGIGQLVAKLDDAKNRMVPQHRPQTMNKPDYKIIHPTKDVAFHFSTHFCYITDHTGLALRAPIHLNSEQDILSSSLRSRLNPYESGPCPDLERPRLYYTVASETQYCAWLSSRCDQWFGWKWDTPREVERAYLLDYETGESHYLTQVESKSEKGAKISIRPHGDKVLCLKQNHTDTSTLELWDAAPDWVWYRWAVPLGFAVGVVVVAGVRRGRSMIVSP